MQNRADDILKVGIELAKATHYSRVTREAIARKLNISSTLVTYYFRNTAELKNAIMQKAINDEELEIISQGLSTKNSLAVNCPWDLKIRAIKNLLN